MTVMFLKKLPQFFLSGSSVRIMGIHTTGPAIKIPRRTNRHLQNKNIIPMCRRIDQTRGTRRTSSFTPSTTSHGSTKFGELITADHKVLSEDSELILQHRCAVVMQDFSFYGIKRNPKKEWERRRHEENVCNNSCRPRNDQD